jgi:hypothetical protein
MQNAAAATPAVTALAHDTSASKPGAATKSPASHTPAPYFALAPAAEPDVEQRFDPHDRGVERLTRPQPHLRLHEAGPISNTRSPRSTRR